MEFMVVERFLCCIAHINNPDHTVQSADMGNIHAQYLG